VFLTFKFFSDSVSLFGDSIAPPALISWPLALPAGSSTRNQHGLNLAPLAKRLRVFVHLVARLALPVHAARVSASLRQGMIIETSGKSLSVGGI
jgi:hypothetical protein